MNSLEDHKKNNEKQNPSLHIYLYNSNGE